MLRVVLVLLFVGGTALAGARARRTPMASTDSGVQEAERLWKLAEAERDREQRTQRWEDTSAAFANVIAANALTKPELEEAAHAAWLALRNAFHTDVWALAGLTDLQNVATPPVPRAPTARQQRMLQIIDTVRSFDATSDDAVAARFFAGVTWYRLDHLDEALPILLETIDTHPQHAAAEPAVALALATYERLGQRESMLALVERLRGNAELLAGRAELARRLDRITYGARYNAIALAEREARTRHDRAYGNVCGEQYLALVPLAGDQAVAILLRAAGCFRRAGSVVRALEIARSILERYPRSDRIAQTRAWIGSLEAEVGNFNAAAEESERAWREYALHDPGRYEEMIAATSALYYRIQLGEWARVDSLLSRVVKAFPPADHSAVEFYIRDAVEGARQAGRRADAVRWLARLPATPSEIRESEMADLLLDLSCPAAPVLGLCATKRNAKLLARARRYLAYVDDDESRLRGLALELEPMLATHASPARLAELATKLAPFTQTPQAPSLRVLAHAYLARIATLTQDAAARRTHLEACMGDAREALVEQPTLLWCEHALDARGGVREITSPAVPTLVVSEPPL